MGKNGEKDAILSRCGENSKGKTLNEKQMFITEGTFSSSMDSGGRFQLPAALREVSAKVEGRFVMNMGMEQCITLYPMDEWLVYRQQLGSLNVFRPDQRALVRYFLSSATEVRVDAKNRLLVPKHLAQYAALDKEVLRVGMLHFLEIWNPDQYRQNMLQIPAKESAAVYELAEKIHAGWQKGGGE